jgi:surface antigen
MRATSAWSLAGGATLLICATLHPGPAAAGNCALYARAQTGVDLYGAAGGWWNEAASRYWRGWTPQAGAILVFKRTPVIPYGHVAVVAEVVGPREIMVDQSNWYRGMVTRDVPVIDESPANNWTMVEVMDLGTGHYGQDYPSYGFVYPQTGPREIVGHLYAVSFDSNASTLPAAYDPNPRLGVIDAAMLGEDDYRRRNFRHRTATRGAPRRRGPAQPPHLGPAPGSFGQTAGDGRFSARFYPAVHIRPGAGHGVRTPAARWAEAGSRHRG